MLASLIRRKVDHLLDSDRLVLCHPADWVPPICYKPQFTHGHIRRGRRMTSCTCRRFLLTIVKQYNIASNNIIQIRPGGPFFSPLMKGRSTEVTEPPCFLGPSFYPPVWPLPSLPWRPQRRGRPKGWFFLVKNRPDALWTRGGGGNWPPGTPGDAVFSHFPAPPRGPNRTEPQQSVSPAGDGNSTRHEAVVADRCANTRKARSAATRKGEGRLKERDPQVSTGRSRSREQP